MCGIAGIVRSAAGRRTLAEPVQAMAQALLHRGPDAGNIWVDEAAGIALSHRRLSILDLSEAGAQPMGSSCGRWVIAFNGEIYNHLELRDHLAATGAACDWRGHSDTETLLAGIGAWGLDETLRAAKGMFALALWDRQTRTLALARDRMGEKPLYWGWAGTDLVFGSELKAVRAHPDLSGAISRAALSEYLALAYVPAPLSILEGVFKLEPGCVLELSGQPPPAPVSTVMRPGDRHGPLSIRRFWSLAQTVREGAGRRIADPDEALSALQSTLEAAIARQMISDVPLGAFLSGGIDSSLVVALMQSVSDRPVRSFTIGFEDAAFNEAPYAARIAGHLGTDHTEMTVTQADARSVIPALPDMYDEPFADSSQIPTYLVCRAARDHVTVALSGDGGDELFGGYNRHLWAPRLWDRVGRMPAWMRRGAGAMLGAVPANVWDRTGGLLSVNRAGDKAHKFARTISDARSADAFYRALLVEWRPGSLMPVPARPHSGSPDEPIPAVLEHDFAGRMMFNDMRGYLPGDILCKLDRAAMAVSLETRVPFLDPDVVALAARLPTGLKIRDGVTKWPLRQLLARHVPAELFERPKAGFAIPLGDWLRGPLREWAESLLAVDRLAADDLLDPGPVRQMWADHLSGASDRTQALWIILMLQAWRERWT